MVRRFTLAIPFLQWNIDNGNGFRFSSGGVQGVTQWSGSGAFLTPPVYSNYQDDGSQFATFDVSEFTALIDGKVCYYPGGNIQVKSMSSEYKTAVAVIVGNESKETRVFRDGNSKEMFITHDVELHHIDLTASGWTENSNVTGKGCVSLHPQYEKSLAVNGDVDNPNSVHYWAYHPHCTLDITNMDNVSRLANTSVQEDEIGVTSWSQVIFDDGIGYTFEGGSAYAREEKINKTIRLRGNVSYRVSNTELQLIGLLPSGSHPQFEQNIPCMYTDNDELGYVQLKTNGQIWAKSNNKGGSDMILLFDGITFPKG